MEVLIRHYRPEDDTERHELADLCERTADTQIGGSGLHYWPSSDSETLRVRLVATLEGQMVGFLDGDQVFAPDEEGEINPVSPPEGYIHCIGVHPEYRRQGIGRRLLMVALEEYERAGFVRVELGTPSTVAAALFIACGGREFGCPPNDGNFEWRFDPH